MLKRKVGNRFAIWTRQVTLALALGLIFSLFSAVTEKQSAQAEDFAAPDFRFNWTRTDKLVADGSLSRTFVWGPAPNTGGIWEDYAEAPGGKRLVQYFDKSRMEITNPNGDKLSPYYVTNGLLAKELITGQLQTGDARFEQRPPADLGVAGDADDKSGPTYRALGRVLNSADNEVGIPVAGSIDRQGNTRFDVGDYGKLYQVSYAYYAPETRHNIAGPFWSFLNQTGKVITGQSLIVNARLFDPVFYATGLPITEAYWAQVKVGGQTKDVLVQAFERRVLTFTPSNSPAFQVEMGNVGQHYYYWRYSQSRPVPVGGLTGKIVYDSYSIKDNSVNIYLINPDGSNSKKLVEGDSPVFTPDGKQVTFLTRSPIPGDDIGDQLNFETINLDGSNRQTIYSTPSASATGLVGWSPEKRYLAYWATQNGPGGLYFLDINNKKTDRLKTQQGDGVLVYDWAPDGNHALWQAGTEYTSQHLYYGDPAKGGADAIELTTDTIPYINGQFSYYPAARFSPDGKTITVVGNELYFLSVPGQKSPLDGKSIVGLGGQPTDIAWSPDGSALAITVKPEDYKTPNRLIILDLATLKYTKIAENVGNVGWAR
jgi:Tol biopolymer transport system component